MTAWKKLRRLPSFILQTASQVFRLYSVNVRCGGAVEHPATLAASRGQACHEFASKSRLKPSVRGNPKLCNDPRGLFARKRPIWPFQGVNYADG